MSYNQPTNQPINQPAKPTNLFGLFFVFMKSR